MDNHKPSKFRTKKRDLRKILKAMLQDRLNKANNKRHIKRANKHTIKDEFTPKTGVYRRKNEESALEDTDNHYHDGISDKQ